MADRGYRFFRGKERADELHDARVGTQHLGIGDTARQNQRVVFVSPDPVDGAVDGDLSPSL